MDNKNEEFNIEESTVPPVNEKKIEEKELNNFSNKEVLTNTTPIEEYNSETIAVRMPTGTSIDINKLELDFTNFDKELAKDDAEALNLIINSQDNIAKYKQRLDKNKYPNHIKYGDESLGITKSKVNFIKTRGKNNVARQINSMVNLNPPHSIPMFASGFRIMLDGASDLDIIELQHKLTATKVDIGRKTNALFLSNEAVVLYQIILEFLEKQMTHTTLDLKDGKIDLRDCLDIRDIDSIVWGIACTAHPKGYNLVRTCKNAYEVEEDGRTLVCNDIVTSKVNIRYMLRPDKSKLQEQHLSILARKKPNTVTVEDIKEYKRLLPDLLEDSYSCKIEDVTFKLKLKFPTVAEYIDNGAEWVEDLTSMVDKIISKQATEETKKERYNNAIASVYLSIYISYISEAKITTVNGESVTYNTIDDIRGVLDSLSKDNDCRTGLIKHIFSFISINSTSIIGIPDYVCEKCKERQVKDNPNYNPEFKNIIQLNPLKTFLDLCVVTKDKVIQRTNIKI